MFGAFEQLLIGVIPLLLLTLAVAVRPAGPRRTAMGIADRQ